GTRSIRPIRVPSPGYRKRPSKCSRSQLKALRFSWRLSQISIQNTERRFFLRAVISHRVLDVYDQLVLTGREAVQVQEPAKRYARGGSIGCVGHMETWQSRVYCFSVPNERQPDRQI